MIMNIKSIIESLLFVNEKPMEVSKLASLLEVSHREIENYIEDLKRDYENRQAGICIVKVGGGYQMCSSPFNEEFVKKMVMEKNKQRLSVAALETLAIIAYKQPVTKMEIESIRGVNVDGVIKLLLERDLIKITGRKDVPGRPFLYSTTKKFLEHFGLNSLEDLPKLEEDGFYALREVEEENKQD